MLCNAIHSNPNILQVEHLDKVSQAQGISEITYHNYLIVLNTTAFQLDLKRPKHSTHKSILPIVLQITIILILVMVVKAVVKIVVMVVMTMITNLLPILTRFLYLRNSMNLSQLLLSVPFHNISTNIM